MQLKNKLQYLLTTDWHIGHKNIIKYCDRPEIFDNLVFDNLIDKINELAQNDHEIIVVNLGDVWFGKEAQARVTAFNYVVNCFTKDNWLIKGNHDRNTNKQYLEAGFTEVNKEKQFKYNDNKMFLSHKPFDEQNHIILPKFTYINGHLHQNLPEVNNGHILISQELLEYRPVTLEEVLKIGATPKWNGTEFMSAYENMVL